MVSSLNLVSWLLKLRNKKTSQRLTILQQFKTLVDMASYTEIWGAHPKFFPNFLLLLSSVELTKLGRRSDLKRPYRKTKQKQTKPKKNFYSGF